MDGIDQSFGFADPEVAKAAGVLVVAGYLSFTPGKNWTPAHVLAYHKVGIGCLMNWESQSGDPLLGASAGHDDATSAVAELEQLFQGVGYRPSEKIAIVFSVDRDVTSVSFPVIDEYFKAAKAVLGDAYRLGVYGEASLVTHLHDAGITDTQWQTIAWSDHVISPDADFYQIGINNTLGGAEVDIDRVMNLPNLGAWFGPSDPSGDDDMTPAESKQLAYVYTQIRAATAAGQTSFASTTRAQLAVEQTQSNQLLAVSAALKALEAKS